MLPENVIEGIALGTCYGNRHTHTHKENVQVDVKTAQVTAQENLAAHQARCKCEVAFTILLHSRDQISREI